MMLKLLTIAASLAAASAYPGWQAGPPTCAQSSCTNQKTPCMDNDAGTCLPRTDPTYNVTSGQCRAGTTDCCCTSGCCCLHDLPCMQLNDFKCMPKVDPIGAYCTYDPVNGYDKKCVCSAGTKQCNEDARVCPTPPPTPPPTPKATPAPTPCNKAIDLLFLVDDSNSIEGKHWPDVQKGIKSIVSGLNVGDDKVRISAATFDYTVDTHGFNFAQFHDTPSAIAGINSKLPWTKHKSGTVTCAAMKWAMTTGIYSPQRGARHGVKKMMIVMTDGKPGDDKHGLLEKLSAQARTSGIHIISIGIGGTYNLKSLQTMASQPYSKNVFGIKHYDPSVVSSEIIAAACGTNTTQNMYRAGVAAGDTCGKPCSAQSDCSGSCQWCSTGLRVSVCMHI